MSDKETPGRDTKRIFEAFRRTATKAGDGAPWQRLLNIFIGDKRNGDDLDKAIRLLALKGLVQTTEHRGRVSLTETGYNHLCADRMSAPAPHVTQVNSGG